MLTNAMTGCDSYSDTWTLTIDQFSIVGTDTQSVM